MGATLVPRLAADEIARAGGDARIKPLPAPVPSRTIGVAWREGAVAEDDARALAAFMRGHLPAHLEPVGPEAVRTGAPPSTRR